MRFSSLNDWLTWQETLHPQAIDLGLERVAAVRQRLGIDLDATTVITIAGTNGKGSCVVMLESILLAAGYTVGTYTSPHLMRYNERIRMAGLEVDDAGLCQAFERVDQARAGDSLSYFEFGTLAALSIFAQQRPDVVLLEVGLGGRLDAVNIIDADVALITSIDIDHSDWLGNDRDSIGFEKAGIFRAGRPAVCGDPAPPASVREQAQLLGVDLYCLGRDFHVSAERQTDTLLPDALSWSWGNQDKSLHQLPEPALTGAIQLNNAASVLQVLALLAQVLPVTIDAIRQGLSQLHLPGRYQRFYCCAPGLRLCLPGDDGAVMVIADVAHNPAAAQVLAQALLRDPYIKAGSGSIRAVIGMLADKDIAAVIEALHGVVKHWYVTEVAAPRACPGVKLISILNKSHSQGNSPGIIACANVAEAAQQALADARVHDGDSVLVVGSFYTVAEFLAALSS